MSNTSPAPATVNCPIVYGSKVMLPGESDRLSMNGPAMAEAVEKALAHGGRIFITSPKDPAQAYADGQIGTLGLIRKKDVDANQNPVFVFEAMTRGQLLWRNGMEGTTSFAAVAPIAYRRGLSNEEKSVVADVVECFLEYLSMTLKNSPEFLAQKGHVERLAASEPHRLADYIAGKIDLSPEKKYELLQGVTLESQLTCVFPCLEEKYDEADLENELNIRVMQKAEEQRRLWMLKEKRDELNRELGEDEGEDEELEKLAEKVAKAGMSPEALKKCESDLKRLKNMPSSSMEANVLLNALDWMTSIPWIKKSEVVNDLNLAKEILDADHYGLDKTKDSILEHLAVQQLSEKSSVRIICLLGPPGVGKTSLGKSIARATGRAFLRISLGGVHDESGIRGHRRAYVGAEPGAIISGMKNAETINPVVLLDEIDKLGQGGGMQGNPTAAMLEVLDPKQNNAFKDHYLGVDYDLSNVLFICTANDPDAIPGPLRDRVEIISIPGYTADEKFEIAKRHLIGGQTKDAGLTSSQFSVSDAAIRDIISGYTSEAGVRGLERAIGKLASKVARQIVEGSKESVTITPDNIEEYLGNPRVHHTTIEDTDQVGVVSGLYWSPMGGGLLQLQATKDSESGQSAPFTVTGNLADVMKESIKVAEKFVKSHARDLGITSDTLKKYTVHVHAPAGAIPKDGPSAGLAAVTAIVSELTDIPVKRNVAMTGEVDAKGNALPIGGLKEKLMGAVQAGATKVLIPEKNVKDLAEVPENIKNALEIVPVKSAMEVLQHTLVRPLVPLSADADKKGNTTLPEQLDTQTLLRSVDMLKAMFEAVAAAQQKPPQPANDVQPQLPTLTSGLPR